MRYREIRIRRLQGTWEWEIVSWKDFLSEIETDEEGKSTQFMGAALAALASYTRFNDEAL